MFESTISFLKKIETRNKMTLDFEWVIKIVNSSENFNHIIVSNRVFHNFLHKWRNYLNEKEISDFSYIFEIEKSSSIGKFS